MLYDLLAIVSFVYGVILSLRVKTFDSVLTYLIVILLLIPRTIYLPGVPGFSVHSVSVCVMLFIFFMRRVFLRDESINLYFQHRDYFMFLFIVYVLFLSWSYNRTSGIPILFENYFIPSLFLIFICSNVSTLKGNHLKLMVNIGVMISIYAIVEYITRYNIIYRDHYADLTWFGEYRELATVFRVSSTIGHPLMLSSFLLPLLPFTNTTRWPALSRFLLLIGILVTGARSAALIAGGYIALHILWNKKLGQLILLVVAGFFIISYGSQIPIIDGLFHRFEHATHSSEIRYIVFESLPVLVRESFWGHGLRSSEFMFSQLIGLDYVVENPWISLLLEIGIVGLLFYCAMMLVWVSRIGFNRTHIAPTALIIAMISGYNSIAVNTNLLLYTIILLSCIKNRYEEKDEKSSTSGLFA
ncbi:hypothetical protein QA601_06430 [Chitinispirillales bacterium ANBcel5]|uniref:hypothetical protein n=1 Tax=Cellulosispirillum alkaliphilum TaxID=3039283 RepID=UPI002A519170|nr:hypothetical protein [Chitinispirillales bacterium ANBcel5]